MQLYYLVAQCTCSRHWYHPDACIHYAKQERELVAATPMAALLLIGRPQDQNDIQTVSSTCWAWKRLQRKTGGTTIYLSAIPLPANFGVPITMELLVQRTLHRYPLCTFEDLFPGGHAFSLTEDPRFPNATYMVQFVLTKLQAALRDKISTYPLEPNSFTSLTLLITDTAVDLLISRLYRACLALMPTHDSRVRAAWETDLGNPLADKV